MWCASHLCSLPFDGVSVRDVLLLCDYLKSHGLCLSANTLPAHPHLPVGHALCSAAQQAFLDDGHRVHRGQGLFWVNAVEMTSVLNFVGIDSGQAQLKMYMHILDYRY